MGAAPSLLAWFGSRVSRIVAIALVLIGRVQALDWLSQESYQQRLAKRIPLRRRFTGREMRPVPEHIAKLIEPFQDRFFED